MATERQAKQAVTKHARGLHKLGAHSLGTGDGARFGHTGYVVIANVAPGFAGNLPSEVSYTEQGARVTVPVVVREMEPFKPEKL